MFYDFVVFIGIEKVGGYPFPFAIIEALKGMNKYILPINQTTNYLNFSFRISLNEFFEEFYKSFNPILYACAMLSISVSRVFRNCFSGMSISNSLKIEVLCIFKFSAHWMFFGNGKILY